MLARCCPPRPTGSRAGRLVCAVMMFKLGWRQILLIDLRCVCVWLQGCCCETLSFAYYRTHKSHHHTEQQLCRSPRVTDNETDKIQSHPVPNDQIWGAEMGECAHLPKMLCTSVHIELNTLSLTQAIQQHSIPFSSQRQEIHSGLPQWRSWTTIQFFFSCKEESLGQGSFTRIYKGYKSDVRNGEKQETKVFLKELDSIHRNRWEVCLIILFKKMPFRL